MKKKKFSIRKALVLAYVPFLALQTAQAQKGEELQVSEAYGSFAIVSNERQAAQIVVEPGEHEVVSIAANLFASDIAAVTSCRPETGNTPENGTPHIIAGTIGTSGLIDRMAEDRLIDIEAVEGKWETFGIKATTYEGQPCLAVYGSDPRGTAYGLMVGFGGLTFPPKQSKHFTCLPVAPYTARPVSNTADFSSTMRIGDFSPGPP